MADSTTVTQVRSDGSYTCTLSKLNNFTPQIINIIISNYLSDILFITICYSLLHTCNVQCYDIYIFINVIVL